MLQPIRSTRREAAVTPDDVPASAHAALSLQAAMLSCPRLEDAAQAAARELATRLAFDRVSIALADGLVLSLVAASDGTRTQDAASHHARLLAALGETFDQRASMLWPAVEGVAVPRITLAHAALAGDSGGSTAGVPLVAQGRAFGALCAQRHAAPAISADELQTLEHLACLAAPVLALMQANQRGWRRRGSEALRAWWTAAGQPRQRFLRHAGCGAAAAAFALTLWPTALMVGGQARLEGAVQRVLTAPADGFVQQVHARPGQSVRAGQPLVDLADQDLLLERQRWQSQLAQHQDAYATAQARADRSQLVASQSKADEAQAQLELVEEKLQRSHVVAPFDGIVVLGDLSQQLGAPVKQGAELLTVAPGDHFRIIVQVDERDVAHVRSGQTGSLALTALPWDTLPMRVLRISPVATAVEGRNVFEVEASLTGPHNGLRPGLQGSARIAAGTAPTLWQWMRRSVEAMRLTLWEWFG